MERATWRQYIVFIPSLSWAASRQGRALPACLILFSCRSTEVGMAYHSHSRDEETEALCGNDLSGVIWLVAAEATNPRWLVTSTLCCRSESLWWWNCFSKFLQVWLVEFKGEKKNRKGRTWVWALWKLWGCWLGDACPILFFVPCPGATSAR